MSFPKFVIFDLDDTLAESKSGLTKEVASLICLLLEEKKVGVISGGSFEQFEKQVVSKLSCIQNFNNLYLAPLSGSSFYRYDKNMWIKIYSDVLKKEEKQKIIHAFDKSLQESKTEPPPHVHGVLIEDRVGQITFSGLGSEAPLDLKRLWDPDHKKRLLIKKNLEKYLPDFEIKIGGTTSIDVGRKGNNKATGIDRIARHLSVPLEDILFVGDALFEGGNDYPVLQMGVKTQSVQNSKDIGSVIKNIIKNSK